MLRFLVAWIDFVVRHRRLMLLFIAASVTGAALYTAANFRLNSNTSELVHQDAPFRSIYREFNRHFPHYDKTSLIVVSAEQHRSASRAAKRLARALEARPDLVRSVYSADLDDFYQENALLYLELDELDELIVRLAEAQPALAALNRDPSLRGLSQQLSDAIDRLLEGDGLPSGFTRMANRLSEVAEQSTAGVQRAISWEQELLRQASDRVHHLVIVQGREDFSADISSERLIAEIRSLVSVLGLESEDGVRVRMTGMIPLAHDELETVRSSIRVAGGLAFALLTLIMVFGVRSLRVVVASITSVVVAIVWTSAFAMATVGEFNTFSMAFSVLLIGLGVDFSIHLCLRMQEGLDLQLDTAAATVAAGKGVGTALSLCALTSSIGFFSFVPTDYDGLAELGIITGSGMFLALIASLSVTPAVLTSMGRPRGRPLRLTFSTGSIAWLKRYSRRLSLGALILALAAALIGTRMSFDYSTLGSKDPQSESMATLRELQQAGILTDYAVTLLAPNWEVADRMSEALASEPTIREVRPPAYYLPANQTEKLELLADAELMLGPALSSRQPDPPPDAEQRLASLERLYSKARKVPAGAGDAPEKIAARRLAAALGGVLESGRPSALALELEALVISDLPERLDWLRRSLTAAPLQFADLPESLRGRLVSENGQVLISVLPREDVSEVKALSRFIDGVIAFDPAATGRPVVEAGVGEIIVRSFYQAIGIALLGITLVVLLALRSARDTLLVLAPLVLTALFTIAAGVLFQMPFNMMNVLVIPLVLGLGVDNGIHIVMRFRNEGSLDAVLRSSTPRAVVLSGLTTLGAFGALSVSRHPGLSSMGALLSISILILLVCTLVVLPALLAWSGEGSPSTHTTQP